MPTYTYVCNKCSAEQNEFHGISAVPKVLCNACGSTRMKRKIGTGSGLIFKGSGFYETDYKTKRGTDSSPNPEAASAGSEAKPAAAAESKPSAPAATESKPAAKSEGTSKKSETAAKA